MKALRALIGLVVLVVLGIALVVYSGTVDVAATSKLPRWVEKGLETVKDRSIDKRVVASASTPTLEDEALVRAGLGHFQEMCVTCHGAPGVPAGEIGQGLNPPAPNLSEEGEEQSPQRLFWVLKNGIMMSGMPAFGPTHTDAQIWAIVAFVKRLPKLDAARYAALVKEVGGDGEAHEREHGEAGEHGGEVPKLPVAPQTPGTTLPGPPPVHPGTA
jgi:mono/diheme cytochrome c family protein